VNVIVSLPPDLADRLKRITDNTGWSQCLFVRSALAGFLDDVEALLLDERPPVAVDAS
jgi:predicted DNA-binding protein